MMNASISSPKSGERGLNIPLSLSTAPEQAKLEIQRSPMPDKALASCLLSSKASKGDSVDSENVLNPTTESSGSDHLSDSQTSSRPSSRSRALSDPRWNKPPIPSETPRTPLGPETLHAGTETEGKRWVSSSLLKSSDPQSSHPDTPQHITSSSGPSPSSAGNTSGENQTYSFVFTSSRQLRAIGGGTLIGVVNPSISKQPVLPELSSTASKQQRKSTLTPEQIQAHALGAIHAVSENSPFHPGERSRPSVVAQMDLPLQTSMMSDNVDPVDQSLQRHGIDFYVNAARQDRNKTPQTGNPTAGSSSSRPANIRSFSHATTLESLGEDKGLMAFQSPPSPTTMSDTASRYPRRRRMRSYSRYVEGESDDAAFTTTPPHVLRREASAGSSASSSRSEQSIDESLTILSPFGIIGSGTPGGVFGTTSTDINRVPSTEHRPRSLKGFGSNTSTETAQSNTPRG